MVPAVPWLLCLPGQFTTRSRLGPAHLGQVGGLPTCLSSTLFSFPEVGVELAGGHGGPEGTTDF